VKEYIKAFNYKIHLNGLLNSYSQLFLSNSKVFSVFILAASFIDYKVGICGIVAVLFSNFFAAILNFNTTYLNDGYYGFNALLSGMFMGSMYTLNWQLFVLLFFVSFLCFMLTVAMAAMNINKGLPYLSIPFLLSVWIIQLAIPQFNSISNNQGGIFIYNELWSIGGADLVSMYNTYSNLPIPHIIEVFLKSLGAIIFQYNLISGTLVAIGLLYFSRIAFTLAILGFLCGYGFYTLLQGNLDQLNYSYIGFNFILTSIALGGFFLIASSYSYFLVIIITPVIAIIIAASSKILLPYQLPVLSLPFNAIVILTLYFLYFRLIPNKLKLTQVQLFSPEKNLYRFSHQTERYNAERYFKVFLPFFGWWKVSQGYNGDRTHKGDWCHALDFVIEDEDKKTYRLPGKNTDDFYCYNLPVLAPSDGTIEQVVDGVEENEVGDVNLSENWGNVVVIRHSQFLFSKLCHLKEGTIKVKVGDFVKKGQTIANNGSSGRSPEPHLHFQLQATPYIGSKTLSYPLSYFIKKEDKKFEFNSFGTPELNDEISNVQINSLLSSAFNLVPGEVLNWEISDNGKSSLEKWEVFADTFNNSYLYCENTKSFAWFYNNGTLFYFTAFEGDRNSLLYYFYLAAQKVLLGFYNDLEITDSVPLDAVHNRFVAAMHDFVAPFKMLLKCNFKLSYKEVDNELKATKIRLESVAESRILNYTLDSFRFRLIISNDMVSEFSVKRGKQKITAKCAI